MEQNELLGIITENEKFDGEAYNIRANGKLYKRNVTDEINIVSKTDKDGIDIIVKDGTVGRVAIPVVLTVGNLTDDVYNDFFIGKNCDVVIVAGCGIDNCTSCKSEHNGIHTFYVGENSKVTYIENHYGHGDGTGKKNMNPTTLVYLKDNSQMIMKTTQIEGIDKTIRTIKANLDKNSHLVINEKVMTNNSQDAKSVFDVSLDGQDSSCKVTSRVVAKDNSHQEFVSNIQGNNKCYAHIECDAIIVNNAKVGSTPAIVANHPDATLVHEATIGKIAGEQLLKLLTMGLDEKQAEQEIINGFLR